MNAEVTLKQTKENGFSDIKQKKEKKKKRKIFEIIFLSLKS